MRRAVQITMLACLAGLAFGADMPREDVISTPAIGEGLCVHNLFQSNMVIQRDKPVTIWGWAGPGEKVTVSFAGKNQTAVAGADRSWKVTFPAMPANSEPQRMTITGKNKTLALDNILLGDVWILGGQSNMQHPISRTEGGPLEIVSANFPRIRILTIPALIGKEPKQGFPRLHRLEGSRHQREGDWDVCSPKTVGGLSAIGYIFARRVHMASRVPIGVIDASRWGTTVETWTPLRILKKTDTEAVGALLGEWNQKVAEWDPKKDLENRVKRHRQWVEEMKKQGKPIPPERKAPTAPRPSPAMNQNYPGNCYASMISPIAGFAVKGAVFHQGFNNARPDAADLYYQVFPKMITAWRAAFSDPEMPFGIISLCTDGPRQTLENYLECMTNYGIYVREAQYKTFIDFHRAGDKNIGFASSFDLRRSWYHPQLKIPAGERIARWALATQYGMEREVKWRPPVYTRIRIEKGKIILTMDGWVKAIDDSPIAGFAIAGEDRRFHPAKAEWLIKGTGRNGQPDYDRSVIVLSSPHVPAPIHFRYAWGRNPMGNLQSFGNSNIPFATQRSDDWRIEDVPLGVLKGDVPPGKLTRQQHQAITRALHMDDIARRLKDAQTFIDEHR